MRILILEDNQERIEFFKRIFKNHELIICELIFSAQEIVQQEEFDIMFLDHDLYKDNIRGIELEITGYDFVKFLVKSNLQKHSLIYIHSMNPTGANAMQNLLRDNGYEVLWIPFHLLKLEDR
jgi:CheY-like chemotaxis protein